MFQGNRSTVTWSDTNCVVYLGVGTGVCVGVSGGGGGVTTGGGSVFGPSVDGRVTVMECGRVRDSTSGTGGAVSVRGTVYGSPGDPVRVGSVASSISDFGVVHD